MTSYDFSGKYFLVARAGGGIGSELSRQLKKSGANVFLCGRDPQKLEALQAELGADGAIIPQIQVSPTLGFSPIRYLSAGHLCNI